MNRKLLAGVACAVSSAVSGLGGTALHAQASKPVQQVVLKQDMSIPGREVIMAEVEMPPGSSEGRHSHPTAELYGFVIEGIVDSQVEGKERVRLKPGDHFHFAPGQVHENGNSGATAAKTYVVLDAEKGKPLTTPAP